MAKLFSGKSSATITALTAATARTCVNVISATNDAPMITEASMSFDGVTASATPVNVELCTSTQATAGTGTSFTPLLIRGKGAAASTVTTDYTAGNEPTTLVVLKHWLITPNGGVLIYQSPLGREPQVDLSGGTIKAIALRATAPANVNCRSYMEFEE